MRNIFTTIVFLLCLRLPFISGAQILTYTTDTTGALNAVATNATGTALTRVNGAVEPSAPCTLGGFSSRNFSAATTYSNTEAAVEATATANSGYSLSVTGFSVDIRRSPTGPANVRYAYSTDGGTTWTNQGMDQYPNNAGCGSTITAAWTTSFSVPSLTALMFRVYGFNASGTGGTFQIMNLIINGTVVGTTACGDPSALTASGITTTTAMLSWTAVSGATSYNIQYRPVGSGTWSSTTSTTASVSLFGLTCSTNYEYQVQAVCASGTGSFTPSSTFTTDTCTVGCAAATGLTASAITTSSATLSWTAVTGAISYNLQYRPVGTSSWAIIPASGTSLTLSGLTCGTNYEFQVQTVCTSGSSSFTASTNFTTLACSSSSGSTGSMAIYFNMPVNNSVSTGTNAIYLNSAFADTLVAYINRAKYTIDIAQYDYNQSSGFANIATAVNNAYLAGKRVRWIYDGSQPNTGLALLNSGINTLASPTTSAYGIMHNKFVIIDANSTNPNDAIVNTGSEDWGVTQFNYDANNFLFIQDSALAHVYTAEFNMMWGDTGIAPNTTLSKFGPYKTDLGRHTFNIGGKTVELYFSPSDNTNNHILSSINSADTDLYFGVYDFTYSSDASAIVARQTSGVYVAGIVDQYSNTGSAYPILTSGLGTQMKTYASSSYVYHNKMVIVDPSDICSDPQVLTGSHNWTTSANTLNDENTLIIHNDTVANIYYQSFYANFTALGGTLASVGPCTPSTCATPTGVSITTITTTSALVSWSAVPGATSYTIQYRASGATSWSTTSSATTSVTLSGLSSGTVYEVQVQAVCSALSLFTSSTIFSTTGVPTLVSYLAKDVNTLVAAPNPTSSVVDLSFDLSESATVSMVVTNMIGQVVNTPVCHTNLGAGTYSYRVNLPSTGIYLVRLNIGNYSIVRKVERL